jgi:hypothetical protein
VGRWRAVRGRFLTDETTEWSALQIWPSSIVSSWESLEKPSSRVKCLPMRSLRVTRVLRDCASREVERALMNDDVVRLSSCQRLVKGRGVLSSTPRTR